ncbi:MAG TPA: maleylpyruvate isomerase family mycothiol-dependent enzyme [Actinomycetota bacterium]|nr:maleylpyruvate isomerase family mycothiol-dependent enzyme [Actinomycetota bacterium]
MATSATTVPTIDLRDLSRPRHAEWVQLSREIDQGLLRTLHGLSGEDWSSVTDCAPWTVKDVAAHVLAWAESIPSPKTFLSESVVGFKQRRDFGGNMIDAQNQHQVDKLAALATAELIERLERALPRFDKARGLYGRFAVAIPYKQPFSSTWVSLSFLMDAIFTRDHFMHHIDICRATGREMPVGPAEIRVAHDAFKEWATALPEPVELVLTGPAGGQFRSGDATATIRGDAIDLCRVLAGRPSSDITIEGDEARGREWLKRKAIF